METRTSFETKSAIGVTIAAALILAAAFMPWGEIRGAPMSLFGSDFPFGESAFHGTELTITITGWNGHITLGGLSLPNWLVVLAAAGVAILRWLKASSVWDAPSAVPFGLAGYGLLHAGLAAVVLMGSARSSAGVGSFLTALAFIGILVILAKQARTSTVSPPNQSPEQ